jgi:hypothetical protein
MVGEPICNLCQTERVETPLPADLGVSLRQGRQGEAGDTHGVDAAEQAPDAVKVALFGPSASAGSTSSSWDMRRRLIRSPGGAAQGQGTG